MKAVSSGAHGLVAGKEAYQATVGFCNQINLKEYILMLKSEPLKALCHNKEMK